MPEMQTSLRHQAKLQGGVLLIYWAILHLAVMAQASDPGWGYLLAIAIGTVILLLWKKPSYFLQTLMQKGNAMTIGRFFFLLALVIGAQVVAQLSAIMVQLLATALGIPMDQILEQVSVDTDRLSMFLYACIFAPIAEELLFRGLVLRSLQPYGKKLAILVSAVFFGLFHGNPLQTPYAFVVGLVLGYVALEHHLLWAIVLHLVNNLLFGYGLPQLLSGLPALTQGFLTWSVILVCAFAAVCVLADKFCPIRDWLRDNRLQPGQLRTVFGAGTVIAFVLLTLLNMAAFMLLPLL